MDGHLLDTSIRNLNASFRPPIMPSMGDQGAGSQQTDERREPPAVSEVSQSASLLSVPTSYYMSGSNNIVSPHSPLNEAARETKQTPYPGGDDAALNPFLAGEEEIPLLLAVRDSFESKDDPNLTSSDSGKQGDRRNKWWLNFFSRKPPGNTDDESTRLVPGAEGSSGQANRRKEWFTSQLTFSFEMGFRMESSIFLPNWYQEWKTRKVEKHEAQQNFRLKIAEAHKNLDNIEEYIQLFSDGKTAFLDLCKEVDAYLNQKSRASSPHSLLAGLETFSRIFEAVHADVSRKLIQAHRAAQQANEHLEYAIEKTGNELNTNNELFAVSSYRRMEYLDKRETRAKNFSNEVERNSQEIEQYNQILYKLL